jgi:hypothetical protein
MTIHPSIQQELVRQHHTELLHAAEQHRLATIASGERRSALRRLAGLVPRRRPRAELTPPEGTVSIARGSS